MSRYLNTSKWGLLSLWRGQKACPLGGDWGHWVCPACRGQGWKATLLLSTASLERREGDAESSLWYPVTGHLGIFQRSSKAGSDETVLIIQECLHYHWALLTQHQSLFCFLLHLTSKEAGDAQDGRRNSQDSWPQVTKRVFHNIQHHAQHMKLRKEEGGVRHSERWHLSYQWSPAFLRMAEHLLTHGKRWIIPCFLWLLCMAFALPLKLSLS